MRWRWTGLWAVLALASLGGTWLATRSATSGPSTYSAGPAGWMGAYRYLEASGAEPLRWQRPLDDATPEAALIVAFPWSARGLRLDDAGLESFLRAGGTLVVAHSIGFRPGPVEAQFLAALDVEVKAVAGDVAPLPPGRWWRWARRDRQLVTSVGGLPEARGPSLAVSRSRWRPAPPPDAAVWLVDPAGEPAVVSWSVGRGRAILFPAELLSNRRLHREPHRDFLATLAASVPGSWRFDEAHHGWLDAGVDTASGVSLRQAWDRLLLQVVLIYLVGAWALARRMGPAWRAPPERAGGSGEFLRRLGRLHEELAHAPQAARYLLERAAALDPRVRVTEAQRQRAAVATAEDLLRMARRVSARPTV